MSGTSLMKTGIGEWNYHDVERHGKIRVKFRFIENSIFYKKADR